MQPSRQPSSANPTSAIVEGTPFTVGSGFTADTYRAPHFNGLMDPLVMVDHYTMTTPTFGAHPHAGLSAVSILFEESEGQFHNRDSQGNDLDLNPGDLYWLKAGCGAVHDESPRAGSTIRGLQVFVNLPNQQRHDAPESVLVRAESMPLIKNDGFRARLVLGTSNGKESASAPDRAMTIVDGYVKHNATFSHQRSDSESSWIIAIDGDIELALAEHTVRLKKGQAIAIGASKSVPQQSICITGRSIGEAHFVLFCGTPIQEDYIQEGPFIMGSKEEMKQARANFTAGKFGSIS
ncbi:pirin family protein [Aurantivibrio plasticivorans]